MILQDLNVHLDDRSCGLVQNLIVFLTTASLLHVVTALTLTTSQIWYDVELHPYGPPSEMDPAVVVIMTLQLELSFSVMEQDLYEWLTLMHIPFSFIFYIVSPLFFSVLYFAAFASYRRISHQSCLF